MGTKFLITHSEGRLITAEFQQDQCVRLDLPAASSLTGNIYVGRVENVLNQIHCAFIEFQKGQNGYYALDDNPDPLFLHMTRKPAAGREHIPVSNDRILVQIVRESMKTKPATVSSKIEFPGRFLILSTDVKGILFSKKLKRIPQLQEVSAQLEEQLQQTEPADSSASGIPQLPFGFILRTNCENAASEMILQEAGQLTALFHSVLQKAAFAPPCTCVYGAPAAWLQEVEDLRSCDLEAVITDEPAIEQELRQHFSSTALPIRLYEDSMLPLAKLYSLDSLIAQVLSRRVWLKSGGYLVIDVTEALTVIDVNTGKSTSHGKKMSKNEAFLKLNKEAASEIAHQIRLRNLSGIILVDFINMHQKTLEEELIRHTRELLRQDPIPTDFIDITRLGLMEITRKKEGKTFYEAWNALQEN